MSDLIDHRTLGFPPIINDYVCAYLIKILLYRFPYDDFMY